MKGDKALTWMKYYFEGLQDQSSEAYIVKHNHYGDNVPSNSITVEGPDFFRLSYCPSWTAPQISCMLTRRNQKILSDIALWIEL